MRALRSLAFGAAVVLTMLLLVVSNIGVWAFARLLDPASLASTVTTTLEDPAVRLRVSQEVADPLAGAVLALGPVPEAVRGALDVGARPSQAALAKALAERIDGLLADDAESDAVHLAAAAFATLVTVVLRGDGPSDSGLTVDLTPVGRLVLDKLDGSGKLGGAIAHGSVMVPVLDGPVTQALVAVVRLLDALRWILPVACIVSVVSVLVLARYRVHALAWVGLCGVVAGTASLLLASGSPVLIPRVITSDAAQATAITAALDAVTGTLVTQSAVLAGLGLALVVAGIAGGVVVSRGGTGQDVRHGWDPGRLS